MRALAKIDRKVAFNSCFAVVSMVLAFVDCQNAFADQAQMSVMASCIIALTTALLVMPPLLAAELVFSTLAKSWIARRA